MSGLAEYLAGGNDGPGGSTGSGPKPCTRCGAHRPAGLGRGRTYCDPCQAERDAAKNCGRCGAPKPAGRGRRLCEACEPVKSLRPCPGCGTRATKAPNSRYCTECRDMMIAASRTRARARRRLTAKQCRGLCGRKGPFKMANGKNTPYCPKCRAERFGPVMCRQCRVTPVRGSRKNLCVACHEAARRRAQARRRELDVIYRARRKALGKRRTPSKPESRVAKNEARRMSRRLNAEARGKILQPVAVAPREAGDSRFPSLPARPLGLFIERLIDEETVGEFGRGHELVFVGETGARLTRNTPDPTDGLPSPREAVCDRLDVATKSLYDWTHGVRQAVQFDTADRVLSRARVPWWDVWKPCGAAGCSCDGCRGAELARRGFAGEAAA